jgi:predicted pyridoxine 5'-phosphate oxidase superfamily flavin-nucleotide-binding protein
MSYGFLDIAITPSVQAAQAAMGSDGVWQDFKGHREFDRFTENESAFIADRDSFYMATVSETGWPYIQHRGGPPGFLKRVDDRTLAFADYRGNRQYISTGNLAADDRACLFLMDYARRARLKIYAHVETIPLGADPDLTRWSPCRDTRPSSSASSGVRLETFDWNCPQHITPASPSGKSARGFVHCGSVLLGSKPKTPSCVPASSNPRCETGVPSDRDLFHPEPVSPRILTDLRVFSAP